jgi:hypothetical protein
MTGARPAAQMDSRLKQCGNDVGRGGGYFGVLCREVNFFNARPKGIVPHTFYKL